MALNEKNPSTCEKFVRNEYARTKRDAVTAKNRWLDSLQDFGNCSDAEVNRRFMEWQRLETLTVALETSHPWMLVPGGTMPAPKPMSRRERIRAHHDEEALMGLE